ncbi:glycosyltransferase [Mycobacterium stomatepiae]|uniref:glycosyltransferase n=1 Tax=Mycobacterium stomatepiae TaxID=470076 RepID=UPI0013CF5770|nr:glycosyltransferase [Mycobacterium stomatepiae]
MKLPSDDEAVQVSEPTAHGALHWAPHHDSGFTSRMDAVARWVADFRPQAFVTDVSVEIAAFVRLMGVPVIVMALPGQRIDAPHLLAYQLADHIVAAWPHELYAPAWLGAHAKKTSYVGGISRFDGRVRSARSDVVSTGGSPLPDNRTRVLVLGGASEVFGDTIDDCARACPDTTWTVLGGPGGRWTDDPWTQICSTDVVVTHAGQGCIADVAAARRPAVVIPKPRPFGEQRSTAATLRRHRLAIVTPEWPDVRRWPRLLARALATNPQRWRRWQVEGAAARAAMAIEATAQRCTTTEAR